MTRDFAEDERGETRRGLLAAMGLGAAATAGSALWLSSQISDMSRREREPHHHVDDEHYHPDKVYDGDSDGTTFTPTPDHEPVQSWDEALPGECELETDEKHWLVSRVDMYDDLDGDDFFEYVGDEVMLYDTGSELRMEVDEDYRGGEFRPDKGYNIPDAC